MHVLVLGQTGSGKTTLVKQICKQAMQAKKGVIVLDPCLDPEYEATYKTENPDLYLDVFWKSRNCIAVIEEAGDTVGRYDDDMRRTATLGRHCGHLCYYVAQRAALINVTVRNQCSELYLFNSSQDDALLHSKEWSKPALKQASQLQPGEYYHVRRMGAITKGNIFK